MFNAVLKLFYQVIGNLVQNFNICQTYVEKDYPRSGILAATVFAIISTTNRKKCYSTGQLIFGRSMILLIKHTVDWELIRQQNQTKINKYMIRKNRNIVEYGYKVRDNIMITNHTAYKY